MRAIRFGMGACEIASGRRPSIDTMTTRRAGGAKVGVGVGVSMAVAARVAVAVGVRVGVRVCVNVVVRVDVKVESRKDGPGVLDSWQASESSKEKMKSNAFRIR
jgi:hypothetical protein